jgi:hypothetical protein
MVVPTGILPIKPFPCAAMLGGVLIARNRDNRAALPLSLPINK